MLVLESTGVRTLLIIQNRKRKLAAFHCMDQTSTGRRSREGAIKSNPTCEIALQTLAFLGWGPRHPKGPSQSRRRQKSQADHFPAKPPRRLAPRQAWLTRVLPLVPCKRTLVLDDEVVVDQHVFIVLVTPLGRPMTSWPPSTPIPTTGLRPRPSTAARPMHESTRKAQKGRVMASQSPVAECYWHLFPCPSSNREGLSQSPQADKLATFPLPDSSHQWRPSSRD